MVRNLEHKNLVKVFAIEEEENVNVAKNVVVMELCEGRSLFNFISLPINRYGLSDSEFLTVFKDVTDGVKYLREKNVVHRDLKPGIGFFFFLIRLYCIVYHHQKRISPS